jgi:hypothetical protein
MFPVFCCAALINAGYGSLNFLLTFAVLGHYTRRVFLHTIEERMTSELSCGANTGYKSSFPL